MGIKVKVINLSKTLKLPEYATTGAAGLDIPACFDNIEKNVVKIFRLEGRIVDETVDINSVITLRPNERALIPSNIKCELPKGTVALIPSRSGLSVKKGCIVINTPGIVDEDYRGIIHICVVNLGFEDIQIRHGDAISQMILTEYKKIDWEETNELSETERADGSFGHSGISRL